MCHMRRRIHVYGLVTFCLLLRLALYFFETFSLLLRISVFFL
jgi:hypothetical protein